MFFPSGLSSRRVGSDGCWSTAAAMGGFGRVVEARPVVLCPGRTARATTLFCWILGAADWIPRSDEIALLALIDWDGFLERDQYTRLARGTVRLSIFRNQANSSTLEWEHLAVEKQGSPSGG